MKETNTQRSRRRRYTVVCALIAATLLLLALVERQRALISWRLHRVHNVIAAGEQGWADQAVGMLRKLETEVPDRRLLATQMIEDDNASIVAEGLLLMERTSDPRLSNQLMRFGSDSRWTWHLTSLGAVCREIKGRRAA
jgi:hypothetical protein